MIRLRDLVPGLALLALASAVQAAPSGYHLADRLPGPDGGWDYPAYDSVHDRVLVSRPSAVTVFDLKTRTVLPALAPAVRGHAALSVNDGKEIAITNGGDGTTSFVDSGSGALLAQVKVGEGPDAATFDPRTGQLLVMNHKGGDVSLLDPKAHRLVATIPVGGVLEAAAVDGRGMAYVNIEDRNEIAVLDLTAHKVLRRYPLPGCDGPTGIIFANEGRLLVSSCDRVAMVVRADTGEVVRRLPIGAGADGVAYDPVRHRVLIPAGRDGTLSVIALAKDDAAVIDTITTRKGARTLTLDPATGRVFLPTADYLPGVEGGRPVPKPGTFELLIISP